MTKQDHFRAACLAVVILMSLIEGCPLVLRIHSHHLDQPIAARELSRWRDRLAAVGIDMTEAELRERTLKVSEASQNLHAAALTPVRPLFHALQISQRWSLFPVADPNPWWMHIDARHTSDTSEYELVYRPADARFSDHERIAYRRIRAHWNPGTGGPRYRYPEFVRWVRGELDAEEVRVRFLRHSVRDPKEAAAAETMERTTNPNGEWFFEAHARAEESVQRP